MLIYAPLSKGIVIVNLMLKIIMKTSKSAKKANVTRGGLNKS